MGLLLGQPTDASALVVGGVEESNLKVLGVWVGGHVVSDIYFDGLSELLVWCGDNVFGLNPSSFSNLGNFDSMDIYSSTIEPDGIRKKVSY